MMFPSKQDIQRYLELLVINEGNLYRLPRVLVLRKLFDHTECHLAAFLANQGNTSRNIVYSMSEVDDENVYFLIEVDFFDDGPIIRNATRWYEGLAQERMSYE